MRQGDSAPEWSAARGKAGRATWLLPCCTEHEAGPVAIGLQGQVPIHLKLPWLGREVPERRGPAIRHLARVNQEMGGTRCHGRSRSSDGWMVGDPSRRTRVWRRLCPASPSSFPYTSVVWLPNGWWVSYGRA